MSAPKFRNLQDTLQAAIAAAPLLSGAGVPVVADKGRSKTAIEKELREHGKGLVVVVQPVVQAKRRDQSDKSWIMNATLVASVMLNPEIVDSNSGAKLDIYDAVVAAIDAACGYARHPGGERFKMDDDAVELSQFDEGLWVYNLTFTKEVQR